MRIFRRTELLGVVNDHLIQYPTPKNLNYFWGLGSLAGICLAVQIISGVFLTMHYAPNDTLAFSCIEHIMRDVPMGWALRYIHANGASIFFIVVYIHIARGLYYGSYIYPRHFLWFSGVVIFILMMATAFMGYVLPWGQMSFWGATVITNLFTAIPYVGQDIAYLLWGGFSVGNPTLNRFFSLHYLLPFLIVGVVGLHLVLLHEHGSSNPLNVHMHVSKIPFYPYFYLKDLFGFILLVLFFCFLVCFMPNYLGHPDNYIKANPLMTPPHIVPEWYFLPFYAILRSIPNKLGGVLCMGLSLVILFILPKLYGFSKSTRYVSFLSSDYYIYNFFFWVFIFNAMFLGWLGACPVEEPYITVGQICTVIYFSSLCIVPVLKNFSYFLFDLNQPNLFSTNFVNNSFIFKGILLFFIYYFYYNLFLIIIGLYISFLLFLLII